MIQTIAGRTGKVRRERTIKLSAECEYCVHALALVATAIGTTSNLSINATITWQIKDHDMSKIITSTLIATVLLAGAATAQTRDSKAEHDHRVYVCKVLERSCS
jgi:hypothetical protein